MQLKTSLSLLIISFSYSIALAQDAILTQSTATVCVGEPVRLTATGCDKTVVWSNGMQGVSIVDTVMQSKAYDAVCMEGENIVFNYDNTLEVKSIAKPLTPYLMCNDDMIKKGHATRIKTFGCIGSVNWSNGETGRSIKVSPDKTTTYTAICSNENNCSAEPISRTIIVYEKKSDLEPNVSWRYACEGEKVLMSADGCTAGTYVWYKHELVLGEVSKTEEIHRGSSVEVSEGGDDVFYTARCQFLECLGNESNRLQLAFLNTIETPEVTSSLEVTTGNPIAVDLNAALNKPMTTGGVYEFRATNDINAPLLTDPAKITEVGNYYVLERSKEGNCLSDMAKIEVKETDATQGTTPETVEVTEANPAISETSANNNNQIIQSTDTGAALASVEPNDELDYLGIPGGFSPNGDNVNDIFLIKNLSDTKASLRVYNRYGHLVFDAPEYKNDWKGNPNTGIFSGSKIGLPDGTYYYSLKLEDGRQKISFLTIAR